MERKEKLQKKSNRNKNSRSNVSSVSSLDMMKKQLGQINYSQQHPQMINHAASKLTRNNLIQESYSQNAIDNTRLMPDNSSIDKQKVSPKSLQNLRQYHLNSKHIAVPSTVHLKKITSEVPPHTQNNFKITTSSANVPSDIYENAVVMANKTKHEREQEININDHNIKVPKSLVCKIQRQFQSN